MTKDKNKEEVKDESVEMRHLRIVTKIANILDKECEDEDDIYFVMRTLRSLFSWESEEDRTQWLFQKALEKFASSTGNREWMKHKLGLKETNQ